MRIDIKYAVQLLIALLIVAALSVAAVAQATKDTVSVDTKAGYARILFTFKERAPVEATVGDGVLTIKLTRPVETTIDAFTESLGAYVSTGRRSEDGLTYRFALKNQIQLHTSTQVNKTVVDLVPPTFKGTPPELPAPPPPPRKDTPDLTKLSVVKVRVGEYSNFTRLVFDWPAPVHYTAYPGRGRITIRFEALARPDFSALESRIPAWVKSAGWRLEGATTVVDFDTDGESAFHDFQDGARIVIDVLAPKTDASSYLPPGGSGAAPSVIPVTPAASDAETPPKPPLRGAISAEKAPQPPAAAAQDAAKPAAPAAKAAAPVAPAAKTPATAAKPAAPTPAQSLTASAELTRDGAALRFPAAKGHAIAVFARGDTIWIVLDDHPAIDTASLLAPMAGILAKAEAEQISGAAVLRLRLKAPHLASVNENDVALRVVLSSGSASPPAAISLTRQGADNQMTLTASLPGAMRVLTLADVEAGDRILVVPARPSKGMLTPKRFVELMALTSAAGLAVTPFTDDIELAVRNETVTFSRPVGLALSSASGAISEPVVKAAESREGPAFIDFVRWGKGQGEDVLGSVRSLRAAVAKLPENESTRARVQVARFLLAHQLGAEALGEIRLIQAVDPVLENDPALAAMKGAAQYMMGRHADARLSLSAATLASDPHAALWRGMAETELGDFGNARRDLLLSQGVLQLYPEAWRTRARLARARTGLAQGDLASAGDALDQLSSDLSPRELVEARLMRAQLLVAQGHVNEAVARLRGLEQTDYPPVAVKAAYARVEAELGAKKTKPVDAIETLETLRYRWRGDDLELKILRKLGELYFADSRWREGMDVLRIASVNFAGTDLAREAQDDMRRAFNDLFLGGKTDAMPPVQALALFYDFIELTPIGRDGDEMIRRLTDRLVAIDLLGPAAQLLEYQVYKRLDGVARSVVATQLAMIYLLDHKPKEALKTLNDTRQTRLPDDINEQRRILEARALAGLKQYDAAVDVLADDDSTEAKRLRADIYWTSENWAVAGAKSEDSLGDRWNVSGPLLAEERAEIMRAAIAYSLAGDDRALNRLRERYAVKMNASPDAGAFSVVTEKIDQQGVAFRDLAKTIAGVDRLEAFMADFKKQGLAAATAKN